MNASALLNRLNSNLRGTPLTAGAMNSSVSLMLSPLPPPASVQLTAYVVSGSLYSASENRELLARKISPGAFWP